MTEQDRTTIIFTVSKAFKDALGVHAQNNNMSVSNLLRDIVAQSIGYDNSKDGITGGRNKKYSSKEERLAAQNLVTKNKRELARMLLAAVEHEEHEQSADALQRYLERRMIKTS